MAIQLTEFQAPNLGRNDRPMSSFALAFEEKPRRLGFFANIKVDAVWATWLAHDDFPVNKKNAKIALDGHDDGYADSHFAFVKPEHVATMKKGLSHLMAEWATGSSKVLDYSDEAAIVIAYRETDQGMYVFFYCAYLEQDGVKLALSSVGVKPSTYKLVAIEEERGGDDFLSSIRDNDPTWFTRLHEAGVIDDQCIILDEAEDD